MPTPRSAKHRPCTHSLPLPLQVSQVECWLLREPDEEELPSTAAGQGSVVSVGGPLSWGSATSACTGPAAACLAACVLLLPVSTTEPCLPHQAPGSCCPLPLSARCAQPKTRTQLDNAQLKQFMSLAGIKSDYSAGERR